MPPQPITAMPGRELAVVEAALVAGCGAGGVGTAEDGALSSALADEVQAVRREAPARVVERTKSRLESGMVVCLVNEKDQWLQKQYQRTGQMVETGIDRDRGPESVGDETE